jgi:hypothetical protein
MTSTRGRIVVRDCPDVLTRPVEIHAEPCKHCPSAHYPPSPEALDMRAWPRHLQVAAAFPCGWRPTKLCKGYCDSIGMTEADLGGVRTE